MRNLHQFFLLLFWCFCVILIQTTEPFLFRRKAFHQMHIDPYQVQPEKITTGNLFKWLNMKHHIKYKIWTRKNPKWAQEIKIGDLKTLHSSNYDPGKLTKVLVHGWAHSANEIYTEDWIFSMRDAYLRLADLNIIVIDYTLYALPSMYWTTAPNLAGEMLGELIKYLVNNGAEFDHFHLLGYSWGAHVAGIAGHRLNGQLNRITGLDPANPTFRLADNKNRLDKSDAKYVDIIHTGGGRFLEAHLGLLTPLGHADFYPNGGTTQPGCSHHWSKLDESIECNHGRSVVYFVESINSPFAFYSCKCEEWMKFVEGRCSCSSKDIAYMGEHSSHLARGIHYLFTKANRPFGQGPHMNLTLKSVDESDPKWGIYNQPGHEFTASSARSFLSDVLRKSVQKLAVLSNGPLLMDSSNAYGSIKPVRSSNVYQTAVIQRNGDKNDDDNDGVVLESRPRAQRSQGFGSALLKAGNLRKLSFSNYLNVQVVPNENVHKLLQRG